tara:strand:+ start:250 stop:657 length:408 start_codon:yes stop_codon:yes gene_type:complete
MPIIHNIKKINPLDLNNNLTIGVGFPLNEVNLTSGTKTVKEQLKTNFLNLLLTIPGERINHPNYGIGLKRQLFNNNIDKTTLIENINSQTSFWLPQIVVADAIIDQNREEYKVSLTLNYVIKLDESDDTIQINYS